MNKIHLENKKEGTTEWSLDNPALNREIEGYASHSSIHCGETIHLYVNTASPEYTITIFRMGWYDGKGGRKISLPIKCAGHAQNIPLPTGDTGFIECDWTDPYALQTDPQWTSGVYVAKLEEQQNGCQSYIIFVVRDDTHVPDILFQLPVTTYQAYNFWGGKCLYIHGSGSNTDWGTVSGDRAFKVSFKRPYARSNNSAAAYGMGAGDFFTNTRPVTTHQYPISSAGWDYNMLRWLEKNCYDVGYISSMDTHKNPEVLTRTNIFLSSGHDEYWSHEMRNNVKNARDQGVNLMFTSSNTMYWQIRFEPSVLDRGNESTMVCYKDFDADPVKDHTLTVNFEEVPEQGTQASLIGVQYFIDPVQGDIKISDPGHWVFRGSNLKKGDRLKGLLGYEIDGVVAESPKNIEVLATTPCQRIELTNPAFVLNYMISRAREVMSNLVHRRLGVPKKATKAVLGMLGLVLILSLAYLTVHFGKLVPLVSGLGVLLIAATWYLKIVWWSRAVSNMTLYEAESGAQVFATGSMQWPWGLDNFNAPILRPSRLSSAAEVITRNVLKEFGAKTGDGNPTAN